MQADLKLTLGPLSSHHSPLTLAQTVYLLRRAKGFSRQQLANLSGVKREILFQIEVGRTAAPHLRTLEKIADAFGLSLGSLFDFRKVLLQDPLIQACAPHVRKLNAQQRQRVLTVLRTIGSPKWLQRKEIAEPSYRYSTRTGA